MNYPRQLPLFDAGLRQGCWNERMVAREYAVHYSSFAEGGVAPYCTVFGDLDAAEEYGRRQTAERPGLCCRIYDHQGLIGAPLREIRGDKYKGDGDISPRFRRWAGSILFFGALILIVIDWGSDFELAWPSMLGSRLIIPGAMLLLTEAIIVLHARFGRRRMDGRVSR